jgi:large subunit ribosomal protein L21
MALLRRIFMIAIVRTGGKQYKVALGSKIKVEKLTSEVGETLKLETLFIGDDASVQIGKPVLDATVEAKVVSHARHAKVKGVKFKAKKRYMVRFGHKQPYTELEITKI